MIRELIYYHLEFDRLFIGRTYDGIPSSIVEMEDGIVYNYDWTLDDNVFVVGEL